MNKSKILNQIIKRLCETESGKKQLDAAHARKVVKTWDKLIKKDAEFALLVNQYQAQ